MGKLALSAPAPVRLRGNGSATGFGLGRDLRRLLNLRLILVEPLVQLKVQAKGFLNFRSGGRQTHLLLPLRGDTRLPATGDILICMAWAKRAGNVRAEATAKLGRDNNNQKEHK